MAPPADRPPRRFSRRAVAALVAVLAGASALGAGVLRGTDGATADRAASSQPPAPLGSAVTAVASGPAAETSPSPSAAQLQPSASPGPTSAPGETTTDRQAANVRLRLQAELDRLRRQLGIPGVSVTIVFADGTRWHGASGDAVVAGHHPVTEQTAFAIASVSKTFTSALILQLVAEGTVKLGEPAVGLLPTLPFKLDRRVTVGMLLNHTSGLADYFLNPKIDGPLQKRPTAAWSTGQVLRYVGKPLSPPGKAWHYSNTNYLLLGLIAEHVTGQSYADLVRTRLLDPTGLTSTWVQTGAAAPPGTSLAHGYRVLGARKPYRTADLADGSGIAPFRSVITAAGAAGSIASTSDDLATWARALYGGKVLGPAGTGILLSGFSPTTAYLPGVAYGYGVQALSVDGHPSLGHSGRLLGFRSAMRHFPVDGLTIAVLTNQSRVDPGVIVRRLLPIALPTGGACLLCPIPR